MEKDISHEMKKQINKDKSILGRIQVGDISTFSRNIEGIMNYKYKLPKLTEQAVFSNLCDMSRPYWNSLDYPSARALLKPLGISNEHRLRQLIKHFEKLDLIRIIQEDGIRRIYINPKYFYKSSKLKLYVLKIFNCVYSDIKDNDNKSTKSKVNRNPEDEGKVVNIPF